MRSRFPPNLRQISGGDGENNSDSLMAQFGLGDAIVVEIVRVEWPSGAVQEFRNAAVNQTLTVTEPPRLAASPRANGVGFEMNLTGAAGVAYEIEGSTDLANWMPITTLTNSSRATPFTDATATAYRQRFYRARQLGGFPNATP